MPVAEPATRPILHGWVDAAATPAWTVQGGSRLRATADGSAWRCTAPGLALAWHGDLAQHALQHDCLCITWGAPRGDGGRGVAPPIEAREVLVRLRDRGVAALAALRGGFGLLFLDATTGTVVLAVDRFSAQTACFALQDGRFAFADRADAVPVRSRSLSSQALFDYLYFHCIPAPRTIFTEVRRLEHGTHVLLRAGQVQEAAHWQPAFGECSRATLPALEQQFRDLVDGAVRVESEATRQGALGCFLSGGTDSSTVAGMVARAGVPARTFSIGFDAQGYDEMAYARIAARHFATEHHEYYVTAADIADNFVSIARFADQPFGNSSVLPAYLCSQLARGAGVTHMLAGDGGDELFGGNDRYRMQMLLELYHAVPAAWRTHAIEPLCTSVLGRTRVPGLRHAAGYVRHSRPPLPDRLNAFNLLLQVGAASVLHPALLAQVDPGEPLRRQREVYAAAPTARGVDRLLHYDWKFTLADSDLPKVRMATRMAGVSVAYPLLADELADFSLTLPPAYKLRHYRLRWFFKRALRDFLPREILRKRKHGFGLPFGPWTLRDERLQALAQDTLAGLEARQVLRPGVRGALLRERLREQPGYYGELVWILMMLEHWLAAERQVPPLPVPTPQPDAVA